MARLGQRCGGAFLLDIARKCPTHRQQHLRKGASSRHRKRDPECECRSLSQCTPRNCTQPPPASASTIERFGVGRTKLLPAGVHARQRPTNPTASLRRSHHKKTWKPGSQWVKEPRTKEPNQGTQGTQGTRGAQEQAIQGTEGTQGAQEPATQLRNPRNLRKPTSPTTQKPGTTNQGET